MNSTVTHRAATLTVEELGREIDKAIILGADGPRFCHAKYVGYAVCSRIGGHDGEHVTTGATGRLIGWDA